MKRQFSANGPLSKKTCLTPRSRCSLLELPNDLLILLLQHLVRPGFSTLRERSVLCALSRLELVCLSRLHASHSLGLQKFPKYRARIVEALDVERMDLDT